MGKYKNQARKITLSVIGLVLVVLAIFAGKKIKSAFEKPPKKIAKIEKNVFVEIVKNKTVPINIEANGNLVAKKRLELYSEVQGIFQLTNKLFRPGQTYRKDETIIKINASEYYASVKSQKSNLYNQISAIMPDLRLDYPEAFPQWQAYLNSFNIDETTPKLPEFTSEKEKYFITARNILSNYYTIKNLEQRLYKYRITAPFSGIVTNALVTEGTLIRPGQKLGEFIETGTYELNVSIPKQYATLLKIGETVTLKTMDSSKKYNGRVVRINGNIDQNSQTIQAYIEVNNKELREGMYLEATLNAQNIENAVEVNRSLLQNQNQLFVVKDSILDVVEVQPVYFSDKKAIVKGLQNGTQLVSKPISGAYPGMLVKIQENTEK